jgi:ABC-type sulfate transport system, periplasmic component
VEPPVAWLDENLGKHGNARVSISFAKFLYTSEAQEIIARFHYRPRLPEAAAKAKVKLPSIQLFTVDELFGGWSVAAQQHFSKGQLADQILGLADFSSAPSQPLAAR